MIIKFEFGILPEFCLLLNLAVTTMLSKHDYDGEIIIFIFIIFVGISTSSANEPPAITVKRFNDTACYGTFNTHLRLACEEGEHIKVTRTVFGAKPKMLGCQLYATNENPQPECCQPADGDCIVVGVSGSSKCLDGVEKCGLYADWRRTDADCDQDVFPIATNYMTVFYNCERVSVGKDNTQSGTDPAATDEGDSNTVVVVDVHEHITTRHTPEANTTFPDLPHSNRSRQSSSGDEMSDSMIAAVVGGSIGMVLTLVIFIIYWGRKKRLRIVSNKQPTVWDYLLSNTFTVRGLRGYDHFSSMRSSVSSDDGAISPVIRKNVWLPNISPESDDIHDDVISNYDNTRYKLPTVEVHPGASPSPYAVLNLETLETFPGSRQRDNEA